MIILQKCSGYSCSHGKGADAAKPFCGNSLSANATANKVPVGECGKCQLNADGGGGASICELKANDLINCPADTSCQPSKVCCKTGECALKTDDVFPGNACP